MQITFEASWFSEASHKDRDRDTGLEPSRKIPTFVKRKQTMFLNAVQENVPRLGRVSSVL